MDAEKEFNSWSSQTYVFENGEKQMTLFGSRLGPYYYSPKFTTDEEKAKAIKELHDTAIRQMNQALEKSEEVKKKIETLADGREAIVDA